MFHDRLNQVRHARGITAAQMAEQLRIEIRSYRYYESGHRQPSLEMLVRIADILEVTTDCLLCREDFPVGEKEDGQTC